MNIQLFVYSIGQHRIWIRLMTQQCHGYRPSPWNKIY
jgi:hypothetical protein